jgi:phosphinothricin acetyltransferase
VITQDAAATIRAATPDDAAAIADVYRPYVVDSVISFEEIPPDAAEIRRRMLAEPRLPWLAAHRNDSLVGYAYASAHHERAAYRWSADVSVYLAATEHRRGTGRALYQQLFRLLRELGYVNAYAGIALPNAASVRLHESMGFTLVGVYRHVGYKHGQWHDVGWWELALATTETDPTEPQRWEPPAQL